MKSLLIIGNADSIWIKNLIEIVYSEIFTNIFILSDSNIAYKGYYEEQNITVLTPKKGFMLYRIPLIRRFLYRKELFKLTKDIKPDIVHVHFVNINNLWLGFKLKKKNNKFIVTYWGSDLLDTEKRYLLAGKKYLGTADMITLSTNVMLNKFEDIFGECFIEKVYQLRFGVDTYKYIDQNTNDYIDIKGKKLIAVGYNGRSRQNHIPIIKALSALSKEEKQKFHILLQMSYGIDDSGYLHLVTDVLKESEFSFTIIEHCLDSKSLAQIRNQVDIFIHGQPSDAFSASLCEYIYARTIILNPEWIHYTELESLGVSMITYQNFSQIPELIYKVINDEELLYNKRVVYELTSWENLKRRWIEVLTS